nr:recombinase family protein [Nitrosomonas nitrosa]
MKLGYARVSTDEQNLDLQLDALSDAGCDQIFQDSGISGAARQRPGLDAAMSALKKGDTLVIWRFDRLGRSLAHLVEIMSDLESRGCAFKSLSDAIDTTTPGGRLHFHMAGAFAQFERDLISERTKAGLKAAKKRGQHVGRPKKLNRQQIAHARRLVEDGDTSIGEAARLFGVDKSTLWRALQKTNTH